MKPKLDWSVYHDAGMGDAYADIPKNGGDFARAVSVCINSRRCETTGKGVMCPSYRVTHRSDYSTGGRVRLLKAALNGDLGDLTSDDETLRTAMELCLGCKGCKRECENEVDMAMIKVEYLAQLNAQQGVSLRTRLLANLSNNLHAYSRFSNIIRWRNRNRLVALLGDWFLKISSKRHLPEPVRDTFHQAHGEPGSGGCQTYHSEVVLLIDTFTDNFSPQQARDAISLLDKAGYKVIIAQADSSGKSQRPLCCGRTHIANGMLGQARIEAGRMLSALYPHVDAGLTIIGLEPACLLAIRDDYRFLGLGDRAQQVAARALLLEEFIAREIKAKRFKLSFGAINTRGHPVLVHGHCHQKAVGAMKSMRKLLKLIPGLDYKLIDSTCCGMAGSFGIEKEHAELAMEMAEDSLLPALREDENARVVANGFSCRHQIEEGTGRSAIHIATLLKESLSNAWEKKSF